MTLSMLVLMLSAAYMLVALIRERGEDERFAGDKLEFRS